MTFRDYDENIILVDESGKITAVGFGDTEVRVDVTYGETKVSKYQSISVVKQYAKMISDTVDLKPGDSFTLDDTNARFVLYDRGLEGKEKEADEINLKQDSYLDECFTVNSDGTITVNPEFEADKWLYETGINVEGRLGEDIHEHYCKVVICKHNWDEGQVLKEADCTNTGTMLYTCEYCGKTKEETISAKGHTEVEIPAVPATETNEGLTAGKKCSVCGEITVAQTVVPKLPCDGYFKRCSEGNQKRICKDYCKIRKQEKNN